MTRRGFLVALPALALALKAIVLGEPRPIVVSDGFKRITFRGDPFRGDPYCRMNRVYFCARDGIYVLEGVNL